MIELAQPADQWVPTDDGPAVEKPDTTHASYSLFA
jgi:hypothetical protein